MNARKIKETCLYIRDLEKAKEYYNGLLNFPVISYLPGKHLFLRVGDSVLLCFNPEDSKSKISPPAHYASGKQHLAFEVSASVYEQTKEDLKAKGIAIVDTVVWDSSAESFYFEDPEGNVLEVVPDRGVWD